MSRLAGFRLRSNFRSAWIRFLPDISVSSMNGRGVGKLSAEMSPVFR